jgi:antitoxin (DNA-binding transcriptional repressor) of toxin-antitoxin stability system
MKHVTVYEAKTHLSELIRLALQGEEIIISRGKKPVVKLVALREAKPERKIGMHPQAVLKIAEDFDAPLPDFRDYMS